MKLEVCVDSMTSLLIAKEAGADRIELCGPLSIGGITPSYGLLIEARQVTDIDMVVMIRPRGGDFLYDDYELMIMKNDIDMVKKLGFNGIVVGVLKADGRIDFERMKDFVDLAKPMKTVLHRAFDDAQLHEGDVDRLIDMGIVRILTSGQKDKAIHGVAFIKELQQKYGDRIEVMPGSGVGHSNIKQLKETTNCDNYHMSGKVNMGSQMVYRGYIDRMNTPDSELLLEVTDDELVKKVRDLLDSM